MTPARPISPTGSGVLTDPGWAARLFRLWPFLSGCGKLASSRVARLVVPQCDRDVLARVRGLPCIVPLDDWVGRAIALFGDLDPKVTWAMDRAVRPGDVVLDVGANLGLVSLLLAGLVGPAGRVHAFEPSPDVLGYLERTFALNADLPLTLHRIGLGREAGRLTLHVPGGNAGRASVLREWVGAEARSHEVAIRPLAEVLAEEGIEDVAFLKLDVEGFESEVLAGLFRPGAPRPRTILFEENRIAAGRSCVPLLSAEGYRCFGLPKRAMMRLRLVPESAPRFALCDDYLAVSAGSDPEVLRRLGLGT